jgi:hypothetical protein
LKKPIKSKTSPNFPANLKETQRIRCGQPFGYDARWLTHLQNNGRQCPNSSKTARLAALRYLCRSNA